MIDYERGLYVRIEELPKGPHPFPLEHGFSSTVAYRVLGVYNPSESGECWLLLSNDRNEMWHISQRHVRTWRLLPESSEFRVGLDSSVAIAHAATRDAVDSVACLLTASMAIRAPANGQGKMAAITSRRSAVSESKDGA